MALILFKYEHLIFFDKKYELLYDLTFENIRLWHSPFFNRQILLSKVKFVEHDIQTSSLRQSMQPDIEHSVKFFIILSFISLRYGTYFILSAQPPPKVFKQINLNSDKYVKSHVLLLKYNTLIMKTSFNWKIYWFVFVELC